MCDQQRFDLRALQQAQMMVDIKPFVTLCQGIIHQEALRCRGCIAIATLLQIYVAGLGCVCAIVGMRDLAPIYFT